MERLKFATYLEALEKLMESIRYLCEVVGAVPLKYDIIIDIEHHVKRWEDQLKELIKELRA
ncbi:MAG: hypothetical protein MRT15_08275 [archaeon YNP-LCB-003-016]|uniref:hypothetical protein n=1 Tax=Candidatus Culexarchaeum yellowstonense TaxID=2928963 RepID=UPI0026ED5FCE|nr:hypothetical protein [Candidatus Culexarchaeum yellowstonense]MCR6692373.1 hypothetical protein [Candidatus Culexarchaeum yellowstonense]